MGAVNLWSLVIVLVLLAFFTVLIWAEIRILRKAGHSGWWVLVTFVPLVNIIMIYVFAFKTWPRDRISVIPDGA